ncbi:MAG: recombinase family protein [Oscillospiraceae bacterium]|nr:recombinase family protein [Oscillospiraceae bacterium]
MKRAAIYIRVSTLEQAQEGYSVGEQKERLIAYCKAHDWLIADVYVDAGYTGSNINRPGMQKLIGETDKFDLVLVYKLDRLSRSQRDTLYLIEEIFLPHNVDFISMQESFDTSTPFGKAMIGLLAVFAQLEREQIKERTRMGRIARAKAGLYHGGGYIPTGYDYLDGKLVINPYEAEQVQKIFEWYLAGNSLKSVAERLHEEGYTTRYGNYSSWSTIRNILENDVYLGHLHFGEIEVDNAHEAIISEEQFEAVRVLRGKRREKFGNDAFQAKHLLTGMLFCGHCGGRYYMRNTGKYTYYSCYSRTKQMKSMIKDPNCQNKHWKGPELEEKVDAEIRKLLESPEMAIELSSARAKTKPVVVKKNVSIEKRIKEIDKQINKLMELYQHDNIPPELLGEKINKLYAEKTTLSTSLDPVEEIEAMPFDLVEELISNAADIWDFADEMQKRRIMQSLISKIVLTDEDVKIVWAF